MSKRSPPIHNVPIGAHPRDSLVIALYVLFGRGDLGGHS